MKSRSIVAAFLVLSGCVVGVTHRQGSLPNAVSLDSADKWKIESGASLAKGATLSGEGMHLHLRANNAGVSYARGVALSPFGLLGPVISNEWEPPDDTNLILTLSIIENSSNLLINPSDVLLELDVDNAGAPESMAPIKYSKFGQFDGEDCEIPYEESCEASGSLCLGTGCSLPDGQRGCQRFERFFPQSPGLMTQARSCIRLTFAIYPPNPKQEFSLKIGEIQAGKGALVGPTILFRIAND